MSEPNDWVEVPTEEPTDWVEQKPEESSKALTAVLNFGQGASGGFADEAAGGVGAVIDAIMDDKSRPFMERYREARDYARGLNAQTSADNPKTAFLSNLAGGIASTAGAPGLGTMKGAAALGGLYGLGSSNADLTRGQYKDALLDTAKGAGTAALTAGVINTATGKYSPQIKDFAARSNLRGAGFRGSELTPSELAPSGSDLLNKAKIAADEGVLGPFASKETMMGRAQDLANRGSSGMGEIIEEAGQSGARINPDELRMQLRARLTDFNPSMPSNSAKVKTLSNILDDVTAEGTVSNPAAKSTNRLLTDAVSGAEGQQNLIQANVVTNLENKVASLGDEIQKISESNLPPMEKRSALLISNRLKQNMQTALEELKTANSIDDFFKIHEKFSLAYNDPYLPESLTQLKAASQDLSMASRQAAENRAPETLTRGLWPDEIQKLKGHFDDFSRWNKVGNLPENAFAAEKYRQASGVARNSIDDSVRSTLGENAVTKLQSARNLHGAGSEFASVLNRGAGEDIAAGGAPSSIQSGFANLVHFPLRKTNQFIGSTTNSIANILNKAPQMMGQYAPAIQEAAARGGTLGTAVYNNRMQQTDPQYRELTKQLTQKDMNDVDK